MHLKSNIHHFSLVFFCIFIRTSYFIDFKNIQLIISFVYLRNMNYIFYDPKSSVRLIVSHIFLANFLFFILSEKFIFLSFLGVIKNISYKIKILKRCAFYDRVCIKYFFSLLNSVKSFWKFINQLIEIFQCIVFSIMIFVANANFIC